MYGMIHRGLRDMVIEMRDEDAWGAIERDCGIGPGELISAGVYDDTVTIGIVQATARTLGQDLGECLRAYGRFWIRFAERGSYGAIMDFTGQDLGGFIGNLDRMHSAVSLAMPKARTPSFTLVSDEGNRLIVRYWSERQGLESFVVGLLEGLIARFGRTGKVSQLDSNTNGTEYLIELT